MKLNEISPLSQRDPKWENKLLGFNTDPQYTIGGYGCLITCLSMITEDAVDFMNLRLTDINGFANGGFYVWDSISKLYPDIKENVTNTPQSLTQLQLTEIRSALDWGYPVMFQIDMVPETAVTDMHYVLCVDYDQGDDNGFTILDPWTGTKRPMTDYLRDKRKTVRSSIEQYIIYTGTGHKPNEPQKATGATESDLPDDTVVSELEKEIDDLRASRNKWRSDYKKLEKECAKKEADNKTHVESLQKTLSEANMQATTATKQVKTLTENLSAQIDLSEKIKKELEDENALLTDSNTALENRAILHTKKNNDLVEEVKELKKKLKQRLNKFGKMELLKAFFFRG